MFKKETPQNIEQICDALKQGAKHYRAFVEGAAIAEGVMALEQRGQELEKNIAKLQDAEKAAMEAAEDAAKAVDAANQEADTIIEDARKRAKSMLDKSAEDLTAAAEEKQKLIDELDSQLEQKQAAIKDADTAIGLANEELAGLQEQIKQFKDKIEGI